MKYRLWCTWHCGGWIEEEADTFEQAINQAYQRGSLPDGDYVEDTFQVDEYASRKDGERPSHWEEDDTFPVEDWQYEVQNNDTRQSYREWVNTKHQQRADDA